MIYIASDHAGWDLKEYIKKYFDKKGIKYLDLSNPYFDKKDDYPVFAKKVAGSVYKDKRSKGILICDTGIGMSIAANRKKGIRAALVFNEWMAERSRQHNDANVLVLGAELQSKKKALRMIDIFLSTPFSKAVRHRRRVKILDI